MDRNRVYTKDELIAKEVTKALFKKSLMDRVDMERVIIKELKRFKKLV